MRTAKVGSNPYDVAVAQNRGQAFVVNDGSVSVISLLTHRQIGQFGTGEGHHQNDLALVRDNTRGYITDNADNRITVVDTETRKQVGHIAVGYGATDVVKADTPKRQRAYVITAVDSAPHTAARNQLIAVSTKTGTVVARTALPAEPGALTVAKGGRSIWVGDEVGGRLWKVSTGTGKITKTLRPNAWQATPTGGQRHSLSGAFWGLLFGHLFLLPISRGPQPAMGWGSAMFLLEDSAGM